MAEESQSNGSFKTDREKDYAFEFLRNLNWNRPLKRTTSSKVWLSSEEWKRSMAAKAMNYELSDTHIDLDNSTTYGLVPDLRSNESRNQKKKKKVVADDFTSITEHVREVNLKSSDGDDEEDDFIDEYGNIKDQSDDKEEKPSKKKEKPRHVRPKGYQDYDATAEKHPIKKYQRLDTEKITHRGFQLEEPRVSLLSYKEQRVFLELLEKFNENGQHIGMDHYNLFQHYLELVKEEQAEFQAFSKDVFDATKPQTPEDMSQTFFPASHAARTYITEYYKTQLEKVTANHLKFYLPLSGMDTPDSMLRMVPLCNDQQDKPQFEMRVLKQVCEMGNIPKILFPSFHVLTSENGLKVTSDIKKIEKRYPSKNSHKMACSQDPNVRVLAAHYQPDVVLSTAAAKVIFNNFRGRLDAVWEIPFAVVMLDGRAVIMVDPPLPPKTLSAQKKQAWFLKKSAKVTLAHAWPKVDRPPHVDQRADGRELASTEDDVFGDVDVDLSALETFGSETAMAQVDGANDPKSGDEEKTRSPARVTRASQKRAKLLSTLAKVESSTLETTEKNVQEEEDEKSLCIDLQPSSSDEEEEITSPKKKPKVLNSEDDEEKTKDTVQKPKDKLKAILDQSRHERLVKKRLNARGKHRRKSGGDPNILGNIMTAQKSMLTQDKKRVSDTQLHTFYEGPVLHCEDPSLADQLVPPGEGCGNVTFNLWTLNPKPSPKASLTIMTRASIHCQQRVGKTTSQRFTLSCKPEYQPHFGCETLTQSELAKDWMSTLLRPGSVLARTRVNSENHRVVCVEQKTLKRLTKDGIDVDFKPGEVLGNLYTLFSGLKQKLPKEGGQYLLYHDEKTGPFVKVLKASNDEPSSSHYDLHKAYSFVKPHEDAIHLQSWLPIDVNVVTPRHKVQGRVPGLFAPKKSDRPVQRQKFSNKKKKS